jgi:hypothetical protein
MVQVWPSGHTLFPDKIPGDQEGIGSVDAGLVLFMCCVHTLPRGRPLLCNVVTLV